MDISDKKCLRMQKFSVLMSVYIKENPIYLMECLDSIFTQIVGPDEVVLVEDGPLTPQLYKVVDQYVSKYPIIKVVSIEKQSGLGTALNEGLKYCTNDLVARMDTDDICKPNRFERQLEIFALHPEIDVCSSWIDEFIDNINQIENQRRLPETHEELYKYAKSRCPVNHPTVMYRKEKVQAVGGYQGFPEDIYLWVKMIMNGSQFYNIQESLLWFRVSKDLYKRRGGWKYAKMDILTQCDFYKMDFISLPILLKNIIVRGIVRIMPNSLRSWVYRNILRN